MVYLKMGSGNLKGMVRMMFVLFSWVLVSAMIGLVNGNVVLIGKNVSLSFEDIEATFAPAIKGSGERGVVYVADPLDACIPLKNELFNSSDSPFALIIRGGCTFDDKVRSAQKAGFKAAIVYNDEEHGPLVAMAGTPGGIHIHAVFVSKASGEMLKKYAGCTDIELWIIPTFENSTWSIMALSFTSLLAMAAVLATCFLVRRHHIRREAPMPSNIREFHGMSRKLVKAMPSLIFTSVLEDNCTSSTCAICLEDYKVGEKLRILPCGHKFHAICIDSWLTTWRTFCPMCKRDARTSTGNPPPSDCTPLLSSAASTPASSFYSSVAESSSSIIQINNPTPSAFNIPRAPSARRSSSLSAAIGISRSSTDLRNASYDRSHGSLGYHTRSSPMNSRFMNSGYVASPSIASPSYVAVGSSGRRSYLRHCAESGASLSAMESAESLPEC